MSGDPNGTRRVLVTGAGGFAGAHLCRALRSRGAEPVTPALDVRDTEAFATLLRETKPVAFVHLAAVAAPGLARDDPEEAWAINFGATRRLAETVLRVAPRTRFIFVGSSDAYGATFTKHDGPVTESAALLPTNVYAATKAAGDIAVGQLSHQGLRAVRFRPFNHTGPGQSETYVTASFARQVALVTAGRQEPIVRVGNTDAERDFLDVRDVVEAYAQAALGELAIEPGLVLNLSSERPVRLSDMLRRLIDLSGRDIAIEIDPAKIRPSDVPRTWGDSSAARAILGWELKMSFERTLRDVYEDWRHRVGLD